MRKKWMTEYQIVIPGCSPNLGHYHTEEEAIDMGKNLDQEFYIVKVYVPILTN